jgi:hypothetical protein
MYKYSKWTWHSKYGNFHLSPDGHIVDAVFFADSDGPLRQEESAGADFINPFRPQFTGKIWKRMDYKFVIIVFFGLLVVVNWIVLAASVS